MTTVQISTSLAYYLRERFRDFGSDIMESTLRQIDLFVFKSPHWGK